MYCWAFISLWGQSFNVIKIILSYHWVLKAKFSSNKRIFVIAVRVFSIRHFNLNK